MQSCRLGAILDFIPFHTSNIFLILERDLCFAYTPAIISLPYVAPTYSIFIKNIFEVRNGIKSYLNYECAFEKAF